MLCGFNLAKLVEETIWRNMEKTRDSLSLKKWEAMYGFSSTGYLLFNVSHWMFAFKYYIMSKQTQS
jgi:hypothetical protein